jgi:CRISPR-associated protein Csm3
MERIPEGVEFNFEISTRVFDSDNKEALRRWLAAGLYLMEQDAIGGSGTRGSGHIEFNNIFFDGKEFPKDWRENCKKEKESLANVQLKG